MKNLMITVCVWVVILMGINAAANVMCAIAPQAYGKACIRP